MEVAVRSEAAARWCALIRSTKVFEQFAVIVMRTWRCTVWRAPRHAGADLALLREEAVEIEVGGDVDRRHPELLKQVAVDLHVILDGVIAGDLFADASVGDRDRRQLGRIDLGRGVADLTDVLLAAGLDELRAQRVAQRATCRTYSSTVPLRRNAAAGSSA
jgi:hypothetical protein